MIAIIDYGLGNLASVRNAFHAAGAEVAVTSDPDTIRRAERVVLPGVGSASAGMEHLHSRGLATVVREVAESGTPFLGICLGMQLLFDRSEEGDTPCLSIIPGTVRFLRSNLKVPHTGWNQVTFQKPETLCHGLPSEPYFYFVHSYICDPVDPSVSAGSTEYGSVFCSALATGSIWATQFHPERSGHAGQQLIRNFLSVHAHQLQ